MDEKKTFHLDRELWPIEDCPFCQLVAQHPENVQANPDKCCQYCDSCGRPRTEGAWAELEARFTQ